MKLRKRLNFLLDKFFFLFFYPFFHLYFLFFHSLKYEIKYFNQAFDRGYSNEVEVDIESQTRASISPDEERDFESVDYRLEDHDDIKKLDKKRINSAVNSRTIFVTSRPHSRATSEYHEPSFQQLDYHQQSDITENSVNVYRSSRSFEDNENTDGISVVRFNKQIKKIKK